MTSSMPRQRDRDQADRPRHWWQRGPRRSRSGSGSGSGGGFPPARSALGLRSVLALFGLVFCGVFAGIFAGRGQPAAAAFLALLALVAVVDLAVILRRRRQRFD